MLHMVLGTAGDGRHWLVHVQVHKARHVPRPGRHLPAESATVRAGASRNTESNRQPSVQARVDAASATVSAGASHTPSTTVSAGASRNTERNRQQARTILKSTLVYNQRHWRIQPLPMGGAYSRLLADLTPIKN